MTDPTPATVQICPDCGATLGTRHRISCRILAEVIVARHRPSPDNLLVYPQDLAIAGCGCPTVLVDAHGPHHGGHGNCARSTWITAVTQPDRIEHDDPPASGGTDLVLFTAAWTDHTVSRHGTHHPTHAAAFRAMGGFTSWAEAAHFLDTRLKPDARPLGVFLTSSRSLHERNQLTSTSPFPNHPNCVLHGYACTGDPTTRKTAP